MRTRALGNALLSAWCPDATILMEILLSVNRNAFYTGFHSPGTFCSASLHLGNSIQRPPPHYPLRICQRRGVKATYFGPAQHLLSVSGAEPNTQATLLARLERHGVALHLNPRQVHHLLKRLTTEGLLVRSASGTARDPYRYMLTAEGEQELNRLWAKRQQQQRASSPG